MKRERATGKGTEILLEGPRAWLNQGLYPAVHLAGPSNPATHSTSVSAVPHQQHPAVLGKQ